MALVPWQATIQDEFGNELFEPVLTVREIGGALATIYDIAGVAIPNPVTGAGNGFVQFQAEQGRYTLQAASGGVLSDEWTVDLSFAYPINPTFSSPTLNTPIINGLATGNGIQANNTDTTAGRLMRADYGYSRGNIVGTVSQTGGVINGAVIEEGVNANGRYTKWADGTMNCWVTGLTMVYEANNFLSVLWTFPAAFSAVPACSAGPRNNSTSFVDFTPWTTVDVRTRMTAACPQTSTTATSTRLTQMFSQNPPVGASLTGVTATAQGRWY